MDAGRRHPRLLDKLGIDRADIVGHDIGVMVAYAYAARYPDKTSRLVVIDSPVPGIPPWNQIVRLPALWHFNFGGPDAERLVAGRERIYLDRFWNEFAGDPSKIDEATRRHYAAIYARPGAMHSAFAQFLAIGQKDEADNLKAGRRHKTPQHLLRQLCCVLLRWFRQRRFCPGRRRRLQLAPDG